ncbi:MBL fold metallo-hydrolase [Flavobacteriaceae bacterium 3-367]|uniref:MBL fold metallo-hydrolase n=1 Tax=Eudoraea algarum TaxID=3417568 RepID=UPI00327CE5A6
MKNKHLISVVAFSIFSLLSLKAQEEEVTITIDTLSNDVYMLTGRGGNIGIYVGEHNVFMIDDQFAYLSDKIKASISTITSKPISFLFNTHMHGDHSGGNANFNMEETTLVAHDNVRKRIQTRQKQNLEAEKISLDYYTRMLPEVTFSDDITFYDGEETIMAFHVHNAHTDGDAIIYFMNNNVLHMGDTYFAGRYPYIDLKSGGSVQGYINAHKKALMVIDGDTKIIPGHGRPSNKKELESYVALLEDIKAKVQTEIDAGKSLEEVKANSSLTGSYDATHGNGYIKPDAIRETFYKSLKK